MARATSASARWSTTTLLVHCVTSSATLRRRRNGSRDPPLRHGRLVPVHEPAAGGDRARPRRDARQRHGRGRRQPEHLLVPGRQLPQHHGLPHAVPRDAAHQAGGELSLDASDPGTRQRDHRPRAGEVHEGAARAGEGGTAPGAGALPGGPQPVALRRPAHPGAARGGRGSGRDRRAFRSSYHPSTSSSSCSGTTSRS